MRPGWRATIFQRVQDAGVCRRDDGTGRGETMRNYWLRVIAGALAIFIVGMVLWNVLRIGRHRVENVVRSDAPLSFPLAFIPFKVDGRDLGTLSRLEVLRSAPGRVKRVNFRVKLADPAGDTTLANCILVAGDDAGRTHTFSCVQPADTSGKDLESIGSIEVQDGETFDLLATRGTLRNFDININSDADSISAHYDAMADSISAHYDAMADSIQNAAEMRGQQLSDSIRKAVELQVEEARRAARDAQRAAPHAGGPR